MNITTGQAAGFAADLRLPDLARAQRFFTDVLEKATGEPVPAPADCQQNTAASFINLQRWLKVLDLAITPSMLRDALTALTPQADAEALLRYFVAKSSLRAADRDKTDYVVTVVYRGSAVTRAPAGEPLDVRRRFENELSSRLGISNARLPEQHEALLREFDFFAEEVRDFCHFDQITDSGIVQRVRGAKESLEKSFYHPRVLAVIAAYNVLFRARFDELFRAATAEIRNFATLMLRDQGSIVVQVSMDAEVKRVAEAEEKQILAQEYGRAQEQLQKISELRKAVQNLPLPKKARPERQRPANSDEEHKIRKTEDMIFVYLRAAGDKPCYSVPLPHGSFPLTVSELAAFRVEYPEEKSFRSEFAALLRRQVALRARMAAELIEYSSKRHAAYRWKPHADSLAYLLHAGEHFVRQSNDVFTLIKQRGLPNKHEALEESLGALGLHMREVAHTLESVP